MSDSQAYACSSHTNVGKSLCPNNIRVRRDIAESALLRDVKEKMLGEDMVEYVRGRFEEALQDLDARSGDVGALESRLDSIEAQIDRLADAIEQYGFNDTLTGRLRDLESEKRDVAGRLEAARLDGAPALDIPALVPQILEAWRHLVANIESLAENPYARPSDIETARGTCTHYSER